MKCRFCTGGTCLLCQLAEPTEAYASKSSAKPSERNLKDNLSEGGRRTRAVLDASSMDGAPERSDGLAEAGGASVTCPICGQRFLDLVHHYNKRHRGQRASVGQANGRGQQ